MEAALNRAIDTLGGSDASRTKIQQFMRHFGLYDDLSALQTVALGYEQMLKPLLKEEFPLPGADKPDKTQRLTFLEQNRVHIFMIWVQSSPNMSLVDLEFVTLAEIRAANGLTLTSTPTPDAATSAPMSTPMPTSSKSHRTPAEDFQHSIKRDPSVFPELTKDKEFLEWHSQFLSLAKLHRVFDVIDPHKFYDPTDDLQAMQNEYIFHVFNLKLKSPRSRKFLSTHAVTRVAHNLYADLLKEYGNENP
ncbi:MAG: hypothetical protein AAFR36_32515, partial [Bacteroidota bacterium]